MGNVISDIFRTYGIPGLAALLILVVVAWIIAHKNAEPGSEISLLWGLAKYKKKYARIRRKKKKPVEVIHENSDTLWRILVPVKDWIDSDLTAYSSDYMDSLLAGPHHLKCKTDLSYLDTSTSWVVFRVRRNCLKCEAKILPDGTTDNRGDFKKFILERLQEAHLNGRKITSGMKI